MGSPARGAFIVEDNGSGIEHPERVFEAGYREAARYADERRSTGMGLANLKRRAETMIGADADPLMTTPAPPPLTPVR